MPPSENSVFWLPCIPRLSRPGVARTYFRPQRTDGSGMSVLRKVPVFWFCGSCRFPVRFVRPSLRRPVSFPAFPDRANGVAETSNVVNNFCNSQSFFALSARFFTYGLLPRDCRFFRHMSSIYPSGYRKRICSGCLWMSSLLLEKHHRSMFPSFESASVYSSVLASPT